MSVLRPVGRARAPLTIVLVSLVATWFSGCSLLPDGAGKGTPPPGERVEIPVGEACWPTYGSEVEAAGMSQDGGRIVYLSGSKPDSWPDDRGWGRDDKAVYLMDFVDGGLVRRYVATTWEGEVLEAYATPDETGRRPKPQKLDEEMVDVLLAGPGDRLIIAVKRVGVEGRYAKIYAGSIPQDSASVELHPGDDGGLVLLPLNDYKSTEGVRSIHLSPDGAKLAAIVGTLGELRIYDLDSDQLTVYTVGEEGETVIEHELPRAPTGIFEAPRQPAIASESAIHLTWAPDSTKLAFATAGQVGETALSIVDVETGAVALVRRFQDSTVPYAAWDSKGESLFVMTTPLTPARIFGDTEIRRLAAAENGREVSPGGKLPRPLGATTEPAYLTSLGDDEHFLFIWEKSLWRLTAPGGKPDQASYIQLTPNTYAVDYYPPSVSLAAERAVFVGRTQSGLNTFVGERSHILDDVCPLVATDAQPAEAPAAEEGTPPDAATEGAGEAGSGG